MKCKVKKGNKHLFTTPVITDDTLIVNFTNKMTYISFFQKKNHLVITTTEGEIDIVFTGEFPMLGFKKYAKDQLIFEI